MKIEINIINTKNTEEELVLSGEIKLNMPIDNIIKMATDEEKAAHIAKSLVPHIANELRKIKS